MLYLRVMLYTPPVVSIYTIPAIQRNYPKKHDFSILQNILSELVIIIYVITYLLDLNCSAKIQHPQDISFLSPLTSSVSVV